MIGVAATVVSLGYYLRFTLALYTRPAGGPAFVRSAPGTAFATATAATAAAVVLWLGVAPGADARLGARRRLHPSAVTFSIVACDIHTDTWGVAVASRSLAVGAVVPWLEAGVGAVATQALTNVQHGPHGLALIRAGSSARETLDQLVVADPGRDDRQIGIVDARGRSASHTGASCLPWAGGRSGRGYAAQGDLLAGPSVIDAIGTAFEQSQGALTNRLLAALRAGDEAGGDRRGRQSAAIRVAAADNDVGSANVALDLRADDHPRPDRRARAPPRAAQPLRRLVARGVCGSRWRASCWTSCATCSRARVSGRRRAGGRPGVAAHLGRHRESRGALVGRSDARPLRARAAPRRRGRSTALAEL